MTPKTEATLPLPTTNHLWWLTGAALATSAVLFVLVVLPTEYGIDPTGFGRATGLGRLKGERPAAAGKISHVTASTITRSYPSPYRCDEIDIPLAVGGDPGRRDELEYKVHASAGDSFVYAWRVSGITLPEEFYADFHGETPGSSQGSKATVVEYRQATGTNDNGSLLAPIDGVHGWYLQNQSALPVQVQLKLCGFYTLIEPGAYGNTAGIRPKPAETLQGRKETK